MKLKIALFLCIAFSPLFTYAQGAMTIFSEDGDKFYLVLNGVKQNPVAQTNVHIDGLANEFYSAKIVFEDASKPEISKSLPTKDAGTGQFVEWTYKIKRTKDGELKLRPYGSPTPVQTNYSAPPDMYVMHYGQPAPTTTVTQTTVTTTANQNMNGGGSISISTGNGGVNMNVNVPDQSGTVTQTTTTTSYSQTNDNAGYTGQQSTQYPPCSYPMTWQDYKAAKATVTSASFEETKLSTAKAILTSNCMTVDQVMDMCRQFGFEASKLDFAKYAYSKTTEQANYFKVAEVFHFDASKADLNNYISSHAK